MLTSGEQNRPVCVHEHISWTWKETCGELLQKNWQWCVLTSQEDKERGKDLDNEQV